MLSLKVATINLRNRADRWLERRSLLVSALIDNHPDLVSLQEISLTINQGRWLQRQVNFRLSGTGNKPYGLVQERRKHPAMAFEAVGILSLLPIVYSDFVNLGYQGRVALRANVALPASRTGSGQSSLDFVAVHLHHVAEDRDARLEQAMQMVGWLDDRRRVPLQVIAGDFNEAPDAPSIRFMRQTYRSAYAERHGRDPLATFPTALPQPLIDYAACLDYVFLSPAVYNVSEARIFCDRPSPDDDTLYPSDHVGLITTLEV
jgi:endonuclease/exonuclease/phosphatase family metal-dependent hydrolase